MRIVYYVVGWPPDRFPNGIVTASERLAGALRRAGHEAHILAMVGAPRAGENHVSIINRAHARRAMSEFAPNRVADLTLAAYTEVLARRRRSGAAQKAGAR